MSGTGRGTKAALLYILDIPPGGEAETRLRLAPEVKVRPFRAFAQVFAQRRRLDRRGSSRAGAMIPGEKLRAS